MQREVKLFRSSDGSTLIGTDEEAKHYSEYYGKQVSPSTPIHLDVWRANVFQQRLKSKEAEYHEMVRKMKLIVLEIDEIKLQLKNTSDPNS